MLNDQQREVAARELCRLRGIDPEQMLAHGADLDARGFVPAVLLHSPAWRLAAREILAREMLDAAMAAGRAAPIDPYIDSPT